MPTSRDNSTITSTTDEIRLPGTRWSPAYDDETGLATLPALLEHLHRSLVRLSRQSLTLALLVTEVKEVSSPELDPAEHERFLREIAARLSAAIRVGDIAGRLAPCTFALLCEDLRSLDEAIQIAQRVIVALDEPFELATQTVIVRPNLGLSFPVGDDNAEELLRRSLDALHAAHVNPRARYDVILGSPDQPRPLFS